ncbi:UNVERIFIED_CONTAM: hypothetical protein GTU68_049011, partial [Idotea baltica]|nr:hypothetical protein [Idotea baltica]
YRGAAPINWALINGEKGTGVTTFYINSEIDKGKVLDQVHIDIDSDDTAGSLHDRMMDIGADLVLKTADAIAAGSAEAIAQKTEALELRPAPKLTPDNRAIDWRHSAEDIRNLIRGLCPYPAATALLNLAGEEEKGVKVYGVSICETSLLSPGELRCDNGSFLEVGTLTNDLLIEEIQLSGKRKMKIKDLLNGFQIPNESFFSLRNTE